MAPRSFNQNDGPYPCTEHAASLNVLDKQSALLKHDVDTLKENQKEMKDDVRTIKATVNEVRDDVRDFKNDKRWAAAIAGAVGSVLAIAVELLFSAFKHQ